MKTRNMLMSIASTYRIRAVSGLGDGIDALGTATYRAAKSYLPAAWVIEWHGAAALVPDSTLEMDHLWPPHFRVEGVRSA